MGGVGAVHHEHRVFVVEWGEAEPTESPPDPDTASEDELRLVVDRHRAARSHAAAELAESIEVRADETVPVDGFLAGEPMF